MSKRVRETGKQTPARRGLGKRVKNPIRDIPPQGTGPWKVFMMVNVGTNEGTKKQTEIRLDTYPELVQAIKNDQSHGDWITVMMLGDFYDMETAGKVLAEWADDTRGPGPRISRGLALWAKYRDRGINLTILDRSKQEVQEMFRRRREEEETGDFVPFAPPVASTRVAGQLTVKEIMDSWVLTRPPKPRRRGGRKKAVKPPESEDDDASNENDDDDDDQSE